MSTKSKILLASLNLKKSFDVFEWEYDDIDTVRKHDIAHQRYQSSEDPINVQVVLGPADRDLYMMFMEDPRSYRYGVMCYFGYLEFRIDDSLHMGGSLGDWILPEDGEFKIVRNVTGKLDRYFARLRIRMWLWKLLRDPAKYAQLHNRL